MIQFTVYGIPKGKGRARVVTRNGITRAFTPDTTADWEDSIRLQALAHKPAQPLDCPLRLDVVFHMPRPKSRKRGGWHDRRPDCDNLLKAVMDALNGLIWTDDARIVDMRVQKDYAIGPPRVEISVEEVEAS